MVDPQSTPPGTPKLLELWCPACGALVEAPDLASMIERARAHTLDAHRYAIPAEHVVRALAGESAAHDASL